MGLWSKLFGSDKIIDAGINGIDKMIFTDQEKSSAKMKFLKLYEPFKLAQRYLAMTFCPAYVLCWVLTFIVEMVDVFIIRDLDTETLYGLLGGDFAIMVIIILSFYFGGGTIESFIKRKK